LVIFMKKKAKGNQLPTINVYNKHHDKQNDYEYQMKVEGSVKKDRKYNHSLERDYKYKMSNDLGMVPSNSNGNIHGSNSKLIKILPYVYNEHINNVYKNQLPYHNQIINKYDKKTKGYDYKPKNMNLDNSLSNGKLPFIPNRKLSPIRRQIVKV